MSYYDSAGINDTLTPSMIGPSTDGTWGIPDVAQAPQPVDAGGGPAGEYSQQVLDLFKYGIGAYTSTQQQQQLLDYKRYEATNGGLYQQGRPAGVQVAANGGGVSQLMVFAAIGIVAVILLQHHG